MFGSLKEKLKGWLGKAKEIVATPEEEKKEKTRKDKKQKKETKIVKKIDKKKKDNQKDILKDEIEASPEEESKGKKIKGNVRESFSEKIGKFFKAKPKEKSAEEELKEKSMEEKQEKKSFFSLFKKELTKEKFDELFSELELILLQNNVAVEAVDAMRDSLEKNLVGKNLKEVDVPKELRSSIEKLLSDPPKFLDEIKKSLKEKKPYIVVFAGINGSGKTTTIAKVAHLLLKHKISVCLVAADTFRAASIEQIGQHAERLKIPLIKKDYGADPASVGFDGIAYARKHNIDVVLIDTAGRMQNRDSLMKEMEKIIRVTKPHMKIFLGESITGNDATQQAKSFNEVMDLTGIILSKADVDEKGGTAISVSYVTGKPVLFLGVGQKYSDLEIFDKDKLIKNLGL